MNYPYSIKQAGTLALVLFTYLFLGGIAAIASQTEEELLAVLSDDNSSEFQKTMAFRHLGVVGTERSVSVLGKMLMEGEHFHLVRRALEPIPSPLVDTLFYEALSKFRGKQRLGLISSIGNRGKASGIPVLIKLLNNEDPLVQQAATHGLARLGTAASAEAFHEVATSKISASLLLLARNLSDQGNTDEAIELLNRVSNDTDSPAHDRNAAKQRLIRLQNGKGLIESLSSPDPGIFHVGLRAARLVPAEQSVKVVLNFIPHAPPERLAVLITLLGDLGEASGQRVVIDAVKSPTPEVRLAALDALRKLGTAQQVPLLLNSANDPDSRVASQAERTLVNLGGEEVDIALLGLLTKEGDKQAVVIRMLGRRQVFAAAPQLLTMTQSPHQVEVIGALGEVLSLDELGAIGQFLKSDSSEVRKAASKAIHSTCVRTPDRAAAAQFVASYLVGATEEGVTFVYDELRKISGPEALRVVSEAARGEDDFHKDQATQALGKWVDPSPSDVLLEIAKAERGTKYGIRCLRGYIRLARQFPVIGWFKRLEMCREILDTATRKEEKVLVFPILVRYGYTGELEFAIKARITNPEVAEEAEKCAITIARRMGVKRKDVSDRLVAAGIEIPDDDEIISLERAQ